MKWKEELQRKQDLYRPLTAAAGGTGQDAQGSSLQRSR